MRGAVTTGSSNFCGTPDDIIDQVFKGSKSVYIIYVITGERKYRKDINIENIVFSYENGHKEFHQVLNPQNAATGDNRYCPGDIGIQIVEDLRRQYKFKSPSQMTATDKNWFKTK
jgi:hypothetical protein